MGYTFTPNRMHVHFRFEGKETSVAADGNNAAWLCPDCDGPVLFVYQAGRPGSAADSPAVCQCGSRFYLDPQYRRPEPQGSVAPADPMKILRGEGLGPV